ncbi:DEHA2D11990p [Debaryomyces hansenii CBS767]|uniref:Cytochrome b-c1 complex subunit 6, mitochondrial n=1 Tax=Debaryomyces hansenii (strain ATCC 36239 / CBS 767 / BCRC 21394 / JCM 1990 / NBRC 0083 / IGC 2968) TaxID=284592 RepID=Q6BS30_DEBHA|nr:DEHA2D11990p [Debaryomyces hansenii CBS767]CAG87158.2 DEHA2D11990p [Debaryomyces hansenii CBS767]|eukprot:XP_458990.2 DEHA2D11990p [Debaryomyces hansenii CBS767]
MSFLKDLIESAFPVAYAEEPAEEEPVEEEESTEESTEESEGEDKESGDDTEEADDKESGDAEEGDEDEDEDEDDEDEDEDEEEIVDPLDTLREECTNTETCKPHLHHFEECIERVTKEQQEEGYEHKLYKEDCVEEFFHLQHCVNDCVAPRLFNKLK